MNQALKPHYFPPSPERLEDTPSPEEIEMANAGASVQELRAKVDRTNQARQHAIEQGVSAELLRQDAIRASQRPQSAHNVGHVALSDRR